VRCDKADIAAAMTETQVGGSVGGSKEHAVTEGALADQYEAFYREFGSPLMRQLRREAYGEDIGQHSWVGADELRRDAQRLGLCATSRLLDLGDGDCGPEQDGAPRHGRSAAKTRTASRIIFLISSRVTAATFSGMAWRHSRSVRPKGGMASQGFGLCIGHNKKAAHEGHRPAGVTRRRGRRV